MRAVESAPRGAPRVGGRRPAAASAPRGEAGRPRRAGRAALIADLTGRGTDELGSRRELADAVRGYLMSDALASPNASNPPSDALEAFLKALDSFDPTDYLRGVSLDAPKVPEVSLRPPGSKTYEGIEQMRGEAGATQMPKVPRTTPLRGFGGGQNIRVQIIRTHEQRRAQTRRTPMPPLKDMEPIVRGFYDCVAERRYWGRRCTECGAIELPPHLA